MIAAERHAAPRQLIHPLLLVVGIDAGGKAALPHLISGEPLARLLAIDLGLGRMGAVMKIGAGLVLAGIVSLPMNGVRARARARRQQE